jgi:AAHS family 4-hydroxybenzoate transporter-like MFS transporter
MASAATRVDVTDIMDVQKTGVFHVRIVVLCALMLYLDGIDNQGIAYVAPALTQAWHMSRGALAPVFTWGIIGVATGALLTGPLTDRFGRRPMMLGTVIWFSLFTIAVTQARDLTELSVLRFLACLGLGGLVPMAVVVASENAPRRSRATMVTLATCGYSIGAASGGLLAAQLVPLYGWTSIFWVGGIAPLVLLVAMWVWLPESVRLLALRPGTSPRIAGILRRVNPTLEFPADVEFVNTREQPKAEFRPFQLFTLGRVPITLILWVIFFLNLTVLNLLNSWLPTLVDTTGLPHEQALRIASTFQLGGMVGVISMGIMADRFGFFRVLPIAFLVGGAAVGMVGSVGTSIVLMVAMIAVAGFCNIGCQLTNAAMAASLYPTDIRGTGVNWAHGVARYGSTIGPILGGFLLDAKWPLQDIFLIFAVPLILGSGCVLLLAAVVRGQKAAGGAAVLDSPIPEPVRPRAG